MTLPGDCGRLTWRSWHAPPEEPTANHMKPKSSKPRFSSLRKFSWSGARTKARTKGSSNPPSWNGMGRSTGSRRRRKPPSPTRCRYGYARIAGRGFSPGPGRAATGSKGTNASDAEGGSPRSPEPYSIPGRYRYRNGSNSSCISSNTIR